jgi:hypothetical protein
MTASAEPSIAGAASTERGEHARTVADLRQLAEARAAGRRFPDFFVIGHQKCGTTALYEMLKLHPQIFMPEVKEPRFFVPELLRPDRKLSTLDGYLSLFDAAGPEQLVGEASPQYIRSTTAASEILQMQPSARVIAILREPASFLRSFHLQMVQSNIESERDFAKALALEPERRAGRRIPRDCRNVEPLLYSQHVRYVEQLDRYYAVLPPERVLVLVYEDFRRDNVATVREVLRFLAVDQTVPVVPVETKPLKAVRSQLLRRVADSARTARQNPAGAGTFGRAVNALTPAPLRSESFRARWRKAVYRTPEPPQEQLMRELRRRYRPEVVALSDRLGRDLVREWGVEE